MLRQDNVLIGQLLVDEGIITPEQLETGLIEQKKTNNLVCTTIIKLGYASEEKVFSLLSRQLNIPYIKIKNREILPIVIEKVSAKFASHYKIIPLELFDNLLTVAIADPLDVRTLDDLRLLLGYEIKAVLASESEIREAIQKYYGVGAETLERIVSEGGGFSREIIEVSEKAQDLEALAEDASIIKFVNQIFTEAVRDRATDIHMEPFENELRIRFRIDGMLYNIHVPETIKFFHAAIVSRIKIMAQLNIAERRLPQDGRIKIKINDEELDLRVSTLPTAFGEAVHIRILNTRTFLDLEKLGLYSEDLSIIERVIKKPHGIVLVTGPTGSGKSTTLYACLARLNTDAVKVITIEDPIEYQLKGINQMQVNPKIGFDFAMGLRHILRHDPNIIMIGEIRDLETAEIAIRSALTGHLVFSTLHTNDAAGGIARLMDMGIEPFLISSSVECLIAQRLVRTICPACKTAVQPKQELLDQIKDPGIENRKVQIYEGKGCKACRFTGYQGRTAIYEILVITELIRDMILTRVSSQQIKQKVVLQGMRTLRQDGIRKVLQGLTTLNEVIRVTQQEAI
jgi:type II secretion system protein E